MKTKSAAVIGFLVGLIILSAVGEFRGVETKLPEPATAKIAVVDVQQVFGLCKKNVQYRQQALAEYKTKMDELLALQKEIEADEAELKALKPDSPDYMKRYEQVLDKGALLESRQQSFKQIAAMKDHRWTEEIYQQFLQVVRELAKEMQIDIVFDKSEPEFPTSSGDELMLSLSTHKVLYAGGCLDITEQVIARLDQGM